MVSSVNNNLISLFGQRSLATTQTQLAQAVERLGSGLRINRAKDDSAGLGIGQELIKQTRSAAVAMRNAQDAISMAQTAEGALNNVSDMLGRLKELAAQGANDALSSTQRSYITQEMAQIRSEINSVANRTTFNGLSLLTGDFSQAVKGEFNTAANTTVDAQKNTPAISSTVGVGTLSTSTLTGASTIKMVEFNTDGAENGDYNFSVNFDEVTLNRTNADGSITSQTIKIGGVGNNAISVPTAQGDTFTLNFDQLGVRASYEVTDLGTRKSGADFAGLLATVGEVAIPTGWQQVSGANWATGSDTVLAKLTSTGGNLRISTTTGLNLVEGFGPATNWTDGSQSTISFIGTAAQINAALATLEVDTTNGIGQIDIEIAPQFGNSGFSDTTILSSSGTNVSINGWDITLDRAILGSTSIGGWTSKNGDNARASASQPDYATTSLTSATYQYEFSTNTPSGTGKSLRLYTTGVTVDPYGVINGPYLVSKDPIEIAAGDTVSFKWQSVAGDDDYDSYAYLLNVDTGAQIELLDSTGSGTAWTTTNVVVNTAGNYKFVFLSGTYDASGGTAAGGSLYLDDIAVTAAAPKEGTVKTLTIASGGQFTVGEGVKVNSVDTSGVGRHGAETGIYRLSGDADAKTLTLKRYDVDGETLMGSETISNKEALGSGRYRTLEFAQMGVSLEVENLSDRDLFLGDMNSGLDQEITIASSKMASLIGEDGPTFQTGHSAYSDVAANLFKDTRMGKNTDAQDKDLFNQVGSMITDLAASSENASTEAFNNLYNKLGELLDEVNARRSNLGAMQNRLQASINNVNEQAINLEAAQGQIMNTDYAAETARMTRMQIGQQAATAMLAQANQLPNVILALLQ